MNAAQITVLIVASLMLGALGCGGPPAAARTAVSISADAVVSLDHEFAARYTEHAAAAVESSRVSAQFPSAAEDPAYRAEMVPYDAVLSALRVSASAVLATESALDAWDAGDDAGEGFMAAAACVAVALGHLRDALVAVGIAPPQEIDAALSMIVGFGEAACHVGS